MTLTSCNDFLTIYPTDRIVGDDFWKTKADVEQMVDGCYQSMLSYSIQERAIMWGAFRSDELVKLADYNDNTLDNIAAVNLLPTNRYNKWEAFYKVINNCNIVLNHAEAVMVEDPEFTNGDYQVVRAQMLALRSLCYFYLVRAFRDVPYTDRSYEDDSQVETLEQSTPEEVLQHCLDDLQEARPYIMRSGAYGQYDWRNKGYMTRDAVDALMADIYLWRAAMSHNSSDYQQAIVHADSVINAKHAFYEQYKEFDITETKKDIYHLEEGQTAFVVIFNTNQGNSHESILEWQYNGRDNSNQALENYYYQSGNESSYSSNSMLMASPIFNSVDVNANTDQGQKVYLSKNDYRFWNNVYDANNEEAQQLSVRKMVDATGGLVSTTNTVGVAKTNSRAFREFRQNWIVYRLTDVMLMKAEALVETANTDSTNLRKAFDLVQVVNKRSMLKTANDTLKFESFKSKDDLELLVMAERERELCFEGKRWWDLMRYCYRHMEGVDTRQKLADQAAWPELYKPMLEMVIRKYGSGGEGDAVSYKMKGEPYLYWPIEESEIKVNPQLKQNPVYIQEKTTSKN
ncbi:MAG: RagB/SusD family nutrient uptake outer membrane protein [Prevotella sp.]|nr:RagB/SusD family nutrient uptake outer membrane protein [Prevotella sp.]